MQRLSTVLHSQIDARPVAFARIAIGGLALLRAFEGWRIASRVLAPETLRTPIIPGLSVPSEILWFLMPAWIVAALLFTLGKWVRMGGAVLLACMFTTLLLDEQLYSNHLYLLCLEVLLLTLASAHGRPWPRSGETVPAWPIVLLQIQLSIVYFFAAVTKITPTFLSGAVLFLTLKKDGLFALPASLRTLPVLAILAALAILTEIFLAFALWSPRYRRIGVIVGVAFHAALTLMIVPEVGMQLFIFSLAVLALYPLFFFQKHGLMKCWQDRAKTIPATNDGDPVAVIETSSGHEFFAFSDDHIKEGYMAHTDVPPEVRTEIREYLALKHGINIKEAE